MFINVIKPINKTINNVVITVSTTVIITFLVFRVLFSAITFKYSFLALFSELVSNKTFMQNEVKRFIENDRENRKNAVEPPKAWKELKLKLGGMNYVDRGMEHKNIN